MPGTSVLPDAYLIDAHLDMPSKHTKLHLLAHEFGGACTKKFSQGSDDRTKGLGYWYHQRKKKNGKKWGGVCKALSVYWIAYHANDWDFWGWLMENGWAQAERATIICDLHGAYGKRDGLSKYNWMKQVLATAHVVERRSNHNGAAMVLTGSGDAVTGKTYLNGRLIAEAVAPNYRLGGGCYRQLSFHGGGGHAVALWAAEDATFFDPNYGEYWFEHVGDFRKWFGHFWVESGYGAKYEGQYDLSCWGKSI
jgi:hypothetical protein